MIKYKKVIPLCIFLLFLLTSCVSPPDKEAEKWEKIVESSKHTEVNVVYYSDLDFQKSLNDVMASSLKEKNGIRLNCEKNKISKILPSDEEIKNKTSDGRYDIIIIPAQDYMDMEKDSILYPKFVIQLPNYKKYIQQNDKSNTYVGTDRIKDDALCFYQKQVSLFYNSELMSSPPGNLEGLLAYAEENPGSLLFPHPESEEGRAFIQSVILSFTDIVEFMEKDLSKEEVVKLSLPGLRYLKKLKRNLYAGGAFVPKDVDYIDDLFLKEVVHSSLSSNHLGGYEKFMNLDYPDYTRAYNPLDFISAKTEYLAVIPVNADNKSGAMYVLNEFLTPEVQRALFYDENLHAMPVYSRANMDDEVVSELDKESNKNTIYKPSEFVMRKTGEIPEEYWDYILEEWNKLR